jgi:hypothetical protein
MKKVFMGIVSSNCLQKIVCSFSLLVLTACFSTNIFAEKNKANQPVLKRGDMVMGNVTDNANNPLEEIKVLEATAEDRVMAYGTTDANGDFSFKVNDPKDSIKIRHKGYQTVVLPLDKKYFSITLTPVAASDNKNDVAQAK